MWGKDSTLSIFFLKTTYLTTILILNILVWFKSASFKPILELNWILIFFYFCNSKLLFQKYLAVEMSQTSHFNWDIFAKQNERKYEYSVLL